MSKNRGCQACLSICNYGLTYAYFGIMNSEIRHWVLSEGVYKMKVLKLKNVINITALSRSTIYNKINEGIFPKPIQLGERAIGFLESEVQTFISLLVKGISKDEMRGAILNIVERR